MSRQTSNDPSGSWKLILLLIMVGAAALMISPVSADSGVTITASGDLSYYQGEKVVFSGHNYDSDTTYLFIEGPEIPVNGGKLTTPRQGVVSGNPGSFAIATTKADESWEYVYDTHNLNLGAGTYTVYAVSQPKAKDQLNGAGSADVGIILKKPFITAEISSYNVVNGQPFTVTGTAVTDGKLSPVQIWILGDTSAIITKTPVNPDGSFTFTADAALSGKITAGKNYLIVEHPMADNQSDFVVSGDYVRNLKLNNGTDLFRLTGPGSLQGSNAADALIAAISDQEANDHTYANDTYTLIPFQVTTPVSVTTGVTISASGTRSYYQGEKVVFSGRNYDSDTTYLFITGPGTFTTGPGVPDNGGKLTAPRQGVVSGNPGSFDSVKTKADKSWEYVYYTHNINVNAGTYTVYAVSQPKANDQLNGVSSANVSIILKKPFLTGEISRASVLKGESFTVSGTAEGDPESVRIWIFGKNKYMMATESVNPDASFKYEVRQDVTSNLDSGQYFVIVQHSMQNNQFDIDVAGDYVRNLNLNNGADLFRISGPGSLQGSDAADALVAAFSDQKTTDDTYTLIPFQVTDAGSPTPKATAAATAPVQRATDDGLLGAIGEVFRSFF
ncbi:MAG: hypothetical protein WC379_13655 [Methanoregula sp.]|jgi:hypothetical protein